MHDWVANSDADITLNSIQYSVCLHKCFHMYRAWTSANAGKLTNELLITQSTHSINGVRRAELSEIVRTHVLIFEFVHSTARFLLAVVDPEPTISDQLPKEAKSKT